MKRLLVAAAILLAGAAGIYLFIHSRKPAVTRYETAKVARGNITARVTATGTLSALVTVQVGAQVSGRIASINVDFNSPVKKGQVIARIDPQLFAAAVEQAHANYVAGQGQLERAKYQTVDAERIFKRNSELAKQKLIAQADLDTSEANWQAAKANVTAMEGQLEQAKASMHQAQVNLDYTTIASPTDGVVISRSVDVGQTVASALQAPTLFTIAQDLTKMQVDTSVAEADVGKLKPDMPATFTVDAYPTERFRGKVRQIRNAPQTVQNVVTYDAVIDVDNADLKLKPGMTANVTFVYAEKRDVLKVPNAAMRFKPPAELLGPATPAPSAPSGSAMAAAPPPPPTGGAAGAPSAAARHHGRPGGGAPDQRQVWVLRGERPTQVNVKIGVSDGSVSEIVEGDVKEGEEVVTDVASGGKPGSGAPAAGGPRFRGF